MNFSMKLEPSKAIQTLVEFISKTVSDAGFQKVVLGVSGGVDSSLGAFLSARALGPKNVLALRLPYHTSSPDSLEHAQTVIDLLGVDSRTIPITDAVDAILANHPDATAVRKGNIMARVRMINIYDQAAALPGLVVGTGNKTESLLGYCTLHGDGAFDFNPLGDLYKYQVRQLARELGVPEMVITKAPSADLWVGQTDEDELGHSYEELDRLLYLLVEERMTAAECRQQGFSEGFVSEIVDRVKRYRFKSTPPLAASLGQYPISELEALPFYSE
jgi:NAD+ synthase